MFARLSRGWALTKASFHVLRLDTEMLLLPVFSGLVMLLIAAGAFGPLLFAAMRAPGSVTQGMFIAAYLLVHFLGYFTVIFFNAAVVHMATMRFEGKDPVLKDGLRSSRENIVLIAKWAMVAATVGLVLRILESAAREKAGFLGQILLSGLGFAWNVLIYFVVPLLVYRKLGPIDALKESSVLVRRAWGEALAGEVGMGLVFLGLGLLGLLALVATAMLAPFGIVVLAILAVVLVYWLVLAVAYTAAQGVLTAALYRFATTGEVPTGFEQGQLQGAFA